jgi:hypothetical protein
MRCARAKSVEYDFVQWDGKNLEEVLGILGDYESISIIDNVIKFNNKFVIHKDEYIIRKGNEVFMVSSRVFEVMFDVV